MTITIKELTPELEAQIHAERKLKTTVQAVYDSLNYRTLAPDTLGISHPQAANWREVVITRADVKALDLIRSQGGSYLAPENGETDPVVVAQHGLQFTVLSGWMTLMSQFLDGRETFNIILGQVKP